MAITGDALDIHSGISSHAVVHPNALIKNFVILPRLSEYPNI
jgi:hypothetical protein